MVMSVGLRTGATTAPLLLAAALAACSTARPLAPLKAGAVAADLSVPGVWVGSDDYSFPAGVPIVGARYGLRDDLELRLHVNPGPLAKGVIGIDGGIVWHALPASGLKPALHVTADASIFTSPAHIGHSASETARGALASAAIAHVEPLPWLWPYVVVDQAFVIYERNYVLSLFVGAQARLGSHWELSLETGLADVNHHSRDWTEPYIGIGGHGAIWMSWGLAYRFGEEESTSGTGGTP